MAVAAVVVIVLGVAGVLALIGGGDDDEASTDTSAPASTAAPDPTSRPDETTAGTAAPDVTDAPVTTDAPPPDGDVIAGAPDGSTGDRDDPVPAGEIADIGAGWRLQILSVVDDGTELVLAENEFNEPPPPGSRYTIVEVALGYYGVEDPQFGFAASIGAVGSANTELDIECGTIPNPLDQFSDLFSGGVVRGNLCFITTPADTETLQLYGQAAFGDQVFLATTPAPAPSAVMPALRGIQPGSASATGRTTPTPIGTVADVDDGWAVAVTGPATDITDAVLAENEFNPPPRDGFRFVGVPVRMEYSGEEASSGFFVTLNAVGDSNVQYAEECGVVPGEPDLFSDVFAGAVLEGQLCFVVPIDDLATMTLYSGVVFDDPTFFATS